MTISGIATQPPSPPGVADVAGCGRYDHALRTGDVQCGTCTPTAHNAAAAPDTVALIAPGF